MSMNTRAISARILEAVIDKKKSLSQALDDYTSELNPSQKGQVQDFCYGVLRNYSQYNFIINKLTDTKIKPQLNIVRFLIAIGLYQLDQDRVAEHAAIGETVEACKQLDLFKFTSLVNALLRSYQRQYEDLQDIVNHASEQVKSNHPDWFLRRLKQAYPKGWKKIVKQNKQKPPFWLRINEQVQSAEAFKQALTEAEIEFEADKKIPTCILLTKPVPVSTLPNFELGSCSVQDRAAQQAAALVEPTAGERILDCCAAPGGKTAHLFEVCPDISVDALDIDEKRLERVKQNMQRLNFSCTPIVGDASDPQQWWDGLLYDKILLDAPCSATGVIRRHPDILFLRRDEDIVALAELQQKILIKMWSLLKPGGTLVYATCSVLPEENKNQIIEFLKQQADAKLVKIFDSETNEDPGWQILPGGQNMDGFYYAKLQKLK